MVAIETKYTGATNFKPSRIIATSGNKHRLVLSYSACQDGAKTGHEEDLHAYAAQRLADKMEWSGKLITGALKNSYVHVFCSKCTHNHKQAITDAMNGN